ncbi:RNA-directed DNA polymerase, eukaryota, reverse transcriptase zinc-binding domain protein [Tanacetum coccineum]
MMPPPEHSSRHTSTKPGSKEEAIDKSAKIDGLNKPGAQNPMADYEIRIPSEEIAKSACVTDDIIIKSRGQPPGHSDNPVIQDAVVLKSDDDGILNCCRVFVSYGSTIGAFNDMCNTTLGIESVYGPDAVTKLRGFRLHDVVFHQLDVTDPAGIASLESFIQGQFGKLDILSEQCMDIRVYQFDEESFGSLDLSFQIEGNAIAIDEKAKRSKKVVTQTFEGAQKCLETNYYGAKHVTQACYHLFLNLVLSTRIATSRQNVEDESIKSGLTISLHKDIDICDSRKLAWIKWSNILASLDKGGLGVLKWIHGNEAGIELKGCQTNGLWARIVGTIYHLHSSGYVPLNSLRYQVGDGSMIRFWKDTWLGDAPLCSRLMKVISLPIINILYDYVLENESIYYLCREDCFQGS